jgi:hypothetical protein
VPEEFRVRGRVVKILKDLHRAQFMEADWTAFLESRPASDPWRRALDDDEWIDPLPVGATEAAAVAWLGNSTVRLRGEVVAERILREIPGVDLERGADGFLRSVGTYWSWIHRGQSMQVEELVRGRARLRMEGPIPYPEWATTVAPTLLRRALELCGALYVEAQVQSLDGVGLRFELRWRDR